MSDIQPVIQVLAQPTLYGTGAVLSMQRGIITSEIITAQLMKSMSSKN